MPKSSRRSLKNKKIICAQCKLCIVEENEESIECDKCNKNFHVVCTSLDKRQFEYLLKNEREEFVCHLCENNKSNNFSVKEELSDIKQELKKLDQLSVLNETMTFMSKQFDDLIRGVAENKKKVESLQKENKELKTEVKMLRDSVKFLNDQRVKNDCLLSGIEASDGESAVDAVLKFTKEVGVEINEESISDAYFLKNKNPANNKKSVVIKLNTKKSKEKLMAVKPKLREAEKTKKIYVNDYLGRETMNLFNYAKSLKKIGYRSIYVFEGRVFTKMSELSRPKLIRSVEEVDELLLKATTYRASIQHKQNNVNVQDESDNSFMSPS